MSGPITVPDGALVSKDPSDIANYTFDWDTSNLPVGTTIASQNTTVAGISGDLVTTPLTITLQTILAGNRTVQVRLSGGAAGSKWRVSNFIVTADSRLERSFYLMVEER